MKECPDLCKFSTQEKIDFWNDHDPRSLKRLGDRLLAESLPHSPQNQAREEIGARSILAREDLNLSLAEVSKLVGVTPEVLDSWEQNRVKPPESLPLLLAKLNQLLSKTSS